MPNSAWLKKLFNSNTVLAVIYSLVIVLSLANLVGTNVLATQGVVLNQIEKEREEVNRANQNLSQQIGRASNLSYIESVAISLGFERTKVSYLLRESETVAAAIRPL